MSKPMKLARVHMGTAIHDPAGETIGLESLRDIFTNQQHELTLVDNTLSIAVKSDPGRVLVVPFHRVLWALKEAP